MDTQRNPDGTWVKDAAEELGQPTGLQTLVNRAVAGDDMDRLRLMGRHIEMENRIDEAEMSLEAITQLLGLPEGTKYREVIEAVRRLKRSN